MMEEEIERESGEKIKGKKESGWVGLMEVEGVCKCNTGGKE